MRKNLTKNDIVLDIYEKKHFLQREIRETVQLTFDAIVEALSEGRNVELRNFGVFDIQVRKPRVGRNPRKPDVDVPIPRRVVVKFKASKKLRDHLKGMAPGEVE